LCCLGSIITNALSPTLYSLSIKDTPRGARFVITDLDLCLNPCERPDVFFVAISEKLAVCPYFKTYSEFTDSVSKTSLSTFSGSGLDATVSFGLDATFATFFFFVSPSGSITPSSPRANITSCSG